MEDTLASSTKRLWHSIEIQEILNILKTSEEGLSSQEVQNRQSEWGFNVIPEGKKTVWLVKFLRHFHDVLIYVLIAAGVITAFLNHWIDTWVIFGVVVINAFIGFIQENRAEKALEGIKKMLALQTQVIRSGARKPVDSKELVPGDILMLRSGDKVPADARILAADRFRVEEATLTGESEPVEKKPGVVKGKSPLGDRTNMVFSGTNIRNGTATAVVVATGRHTELGKISAMISEVEQLKTPLIQQINRFGKQLSFGILALTGVLFLIGLFVRNYSVNDMVFAAIGMAVAAIPEGLPAVLSITLALGVQRMARRNAIIRRLPSVETLGSVSVICSDKTGTLTKNEMTAKALITRDSQYTVEGVGYQPEGKLYHETKPIPPGSRSEDLDRLLLISWLCNNADIKKNEEGEWVVLGEPTEGALTTLVIKAGMDSSKPKRLHTIPFDSEHKYMATMHDWDNSRWIFVKGAPDRLLEMSDQEFSNGKNQSLNEKFWIEEIQNLAQEGQRVLGAAFCKVEKDRNHFDHEDLLGGLIFTGLIGIMDPPRPEAIEAIRECQEAGIRVKMITGDHMATAQAIGKAMGISDEGKAISGTELEELSEEELKIVVLKYDIFARTSPEHKLRLVRALQSHGIVCAMTGDGVNDAPALKRADVGIAMGIKGTEVAKEAAEMILVDDNFASIVNAVEEGRTIYGNLRKTILFILPTNGAEALVIILAIITGRMLPITPLQILWVNMVTAITLALALAFEPMEKDTMKKPPRDPKKSILDKYFLWRISFVSVLIGGLTFLLFQTLRNEGYDLATSRTISVHTLVFGQLFYLFNSRSLQLPALSKDIFRNRVAWIVSGILLILQICLTYLPAMNTVFGTTPIGGAYWFFPISIGILVFFVVELEKWILRKGKLKIS